MTTWGVVYLVVQGAVFALWAFQMFRALFQARRIAVANSGKIWPGPFAALAALRDWARSHPRERNQLLVTTAVLFLFITLGPLRATLHP
ncbi:hypothetical protein JQX09_11650 [Sulfitobacter pseudonitzschiae]|uniref:Uncharacterized protein n=1 Tax=Pseudosulfitobacter pseudonitzschiae TaxID=1402135 RepID=A0A9Q2NQT0_9RHOB|nr:hypothetical protein [Pseudosulfitobacter pseudonitzschiae]MBM2292572.1 hypothetical protein [Pseudosulfitobacter pseudonitzschiae]MBM2297489.1 hypothetical protein [Pseudosulfitobacter pseudonitzschiae]MBM2302403.1 hypothetical protein [Pseudosulfitobacter pseudonitzschiae]MBM2312186.1 hypothetical protein [Pseudosulfitobacter pseudonitzschiae]MBM2317099.1 hypothetical protein [Pseudosulfitobacter pseudonitzschiae]